MEIIAGLIGATAGAVVAFMLSGWHERRQARKKVVAAVRGEFSLAVGLADQVLSANREFIEWQHQDGSRPWPRCEFTIFPTSAWSSVVGGGGLGELSFEAIDAASKAHAAILRANYVAEKVQTTGFSPAEGHQYNELLADVRNHLRDALEQFPRQPA